MKRLITGVMLTLLFLFLIAVSFPVALAVGNPELFGPSRPKARETLDPNDPRPVVALTIDDGWDVRAFDDMLILLEKHNTQATFFLVGTAAKKLGADRLKLLVVSGHEIGFHSYNHDNQWEMRIWDTAYWDLDYHAWEKTLKVLMGEELFNQGVVLYARVPWGLKSGGFSEMARDRGMKVIGWSVDPATAPGSERHLTDGDILLLHVKREDVKILAEVLAKGDVRFVPISVLLSDSNG